MQPVTQSTRSRCFWATEPGFFLPLPVFLDRARHQKPGSVAHNINCSTKWSSLPARTRALIPYISIWIFIFGPKKLPGLSRNGPLILLSAVFLQQLWSLTPLSPLRKRRLIKPSPSAAVLGTLEFSQNTIFKDGPFHKPYWLPRAPLPHPSEFCVCI